MTGKQQYTLHVVLNVTTYRLTLSEISFLQNCRSKVINGDYECRNRGIASYTGETSMLTSIVCNDRIDNGLIITSGIIIPSLNFPIHLSQRQSK